MMHVVAAVIHELGGLGGAGAFVASLAAWRSARQAAGPSDLDPLGKRLDMIETSLVEMRRHLSRQVDYLHDVDHTQECELKHHGRRLDNHDSRLHTIEAHNR
nr:MAG TPA: hypothetical protein [Caudoviricetes sp.]